MQGLADGYFVLPYTIGDYLASNKLDKVDADASRRRARPKSQRHAITQQAARQARATRTVDSFHRELGKIMWEYCGMARNAGGPEEGARARSRALREEFWKDVKVLGADEELNQSLEKAGRVADFFELAELMCLDALERNESCGGHFREEYQTPEGEAQRDDEQLLLRRRLGISQGAGKPPVLHKEPLTFEYVHPCATELQVMKLILHIWRQKNAARRGPHGPLRSRRTSAETCRSSKCSTC